MDSVTYSVIMLAIFFGAPTAIKLARVAIGKIAGLMLKSLKKKKKIRMKNDKSFQKQQLKEKGLEDNLGKKVGVRFFNSKSKTSQKMSVVMDKGCDIDDDIILKGTITVKGTNGLVIKEPIYLFQPELFNSKGQKLGPVKNKDGTLTDDNPYFVRMQNGEVGRGYALKREVTSGMCFDFVKGSVHSQIPGLERYLSIDIPRDEKGNYIPMDTSDPKELQAFKKYIESRQKLENVGNYLHYLIETAQEAKANERVVYAAATGYYSVDEHREAVEAAKEAAKDKPFDSTAHLQIYEDVYGLRTQLMMDEFQEQDAVMLPPKNVGSHRVMGSRPRYAPNQRKR